MVPESIHLVLAAKIVGFLIGAVAWITSGELIGVIFGARLAHRASSITLKRGAGLVCLVIGTWLLIRNL